MDNNIGKTTKTEFPKGAVREIGALVAGVRDKSLDPTIYDAPYAHIVQELENISVLDTASRVNKLLELSKQYNLDNGALFEAILTEDLHVLRPRVASRWPAPLGQEAFYGDVGALTNELAAGTEADSAGVLLSLLVTIGTIIGRGGTNNERRGPFIFAGGYHHTNEFLCLVGESAVSRKGTGYTVAKLALGLVDSLFIKNNIETSLSTGEGLIQLVQDDVKKTKINIYNGLKYDEVVAPGIDDKRKVIWLSEFAALLEVMARPGATLPSTLREVWDGGDLSNPNKTSPARSTSPHISIIAAVTKQELMELLADTSNTVNGFANRFLWCAVKKSKDLPHGGDVPSMSDLTHCINDDLIWIQENARCQIYRSSNAVEYWDELYRGFDSGAYGIHQSVTSRGLQHIIRLSTIYALMDKSLEIQIAHIEAARAVWEYCSDSAKLIFGESTGNALADKILDEIENSSYDGINKAALAATLKKSHGLFEIKVAFNLLEDIGLIHTYKTITGTRGNIEERLYSL